jgi:hypothetical protein
MWLLLTLLQRWTGPASPKPRTFQAAAGMLRHVLLVPPVVLLLLELTPLSCCRPPTSGAASAAALSITFPAESLLNAPSPRPDQDAALPHLVLHLC